VIRSGCSIVLIGRKTNERPTINGETTRSGRFDAPAEV
jgi:hypothetical protein